MTHSATLTDRSVLKITGSDAEPFLQNLVTCDVSGLIDKQATFGGLLTPQGKILYEFLVRKAEGEFLLDCHSDFSEELMKRLNFYKLRAAVSVEKHACGVNVFWGGKPPSDTECFQDPRVPELGYRAYSYSIVDPSDTALWRHHRIQCGVPELGPDFGPSEVFPHDALYDQYTDAGVDFSKGCYVGQEVVSRMQHRGTARNRFVRCRLADGNAKLNSGAEIFAGDRKVGSVTSTYEAIGLALVRWDRVQSAVQSDLSITVDGSKVELSPPQFASFGTDE